MAAVVSMQQAERKDTFCDGYILQLPLSYDYYGAYGNKVNDPNGYYDSVKMDYSFDFTQNHDIVSVKLLN